MQTTVGPGITTNANDWLDKMSMSRIKTTWVVIIKIIYIYISLYYIDWLEPEPTITFHIGWYHSSWNISSHSSPFQGCAQWTQIPLVKFVNSGGHKTAPLDNLRPKFLRLGRCFGCLDAVKPWLVWGAPWKILFFSNLFHILLGMIPRNDTKCIYHIYLNVAYPKCDGSEIRNGMILVAQSPNSWLQCNPADVHCFLTASPPNKAQNMVENGWKSWGKLW